MPRAVAAAPVLGRRPLVVRALLGAVVLAVVAAVSGCGEPTPTQKQFSDALVTSGVPRDVADCTAKAVESSLSKAEFQKLVERGSGGAPVDDPKTNNDSADKLRKAMDRCRALAAPPTTVPTTTVPAGSGSPTTAVPTGSGSPTTAVPTGSGSPTTAVPTSVVPTTDGAAFNTTSTP